MRKAVLLASVISLSLAGCFEVRQTAVVNADGSIRSTIEARFDRAEYDRASAKTKSQCSTIEGKDGEITIYSSSRFEGSKFVCEFVANIPPSATVGIGWLDVARLDGGRVFLSANPAGFVSDMEIEQPGILKRYRSALAGQSWTVSITGPKIIDSNGLKDGQKAAWDFSIIDILEGAPNKGTLATATVSY